MKKLFVFTIFAAFVAFMLVPYADAQTRRRRSNPGLATNIAIVAGSTAAGALIGRGRTGALMGAGAGLLYASSRRGTKRRSLNSPYRRAAKITGGGLLGAGIGRWAGGTSGMILGAAVGTGATYLYTRQGRRYYVTQGGRQYYISNGRRVYVN